MAYRFKRKESVAKAVRRLGRERIEKALDCLKEHDRAEAIHCARKEIKKLRAVLRLVRGRIGKEDFKGIAGQLREAAARLAPNRDAHVKLATLGKILKDSKGKLGAKALPAVRASLRTNCHREMKRFSKRKTAKCVGRLLRRAEKDLERVHLSAKGWSALRRGVKEAYARGRKAYQIVQDHNSPECFHQWRKRAKDLWYQLTLLGPIWPRQLDAMNRELEGLTERLGEYHDLTVLQRTIEKLAHRNGDADEVQILKRLIEEREREARVMARSLGARFYAEKPSAFCGRLARRWEIWRARKQSTIPSLQKAA